MNYEETPYGFKWGPVEVICLAHSEREGWVVIEIKTQKASEEFYITKSGRIKCIRKVKLWRAKKK